jgi:hypothetical protein
VRIFIKHRSEAQAIKLLEQERAEEYFQRLVELREPEPEDIEDEEDPGLNAIHEADERFDWISGQYEMIEEED